MIYPLYIGILLLDSIHNETQTGARPMTNTERAYRSLNDAIEGLTFDVFTSKAAQKRVLDRLNKAYEYASHAYADLYRADLTAKLAGTSERDNEAISLFFSSREVPFDLHHVRDLHIDRIKEYSAELADLVTRARDLRIDTKACEIVAPVKANAAEVAKVAQIHRTIGEEMRRLEKMYHRGLDLGRLFGGLNVYANVHLVTNQHGTNFLRAFYYLEGTRTPLNTLLAVLQKLEEERA
jgi:hypothetical protein